MSAMEKMFASMIEKAIPPEIMELLSQENIEAITETVKAYMIAQKAQLDKLEENQETILSELEEIRKGIKNGKPTTRASSRRGSEESGKSGRDSGSD